MVSSCWAGPIGGNKPETNNHFPFHQIGILHLQQELEVVVVHPFVLNNIDILKITHTSGQGIAEIVRSYPMGEGCVFPMCEQQILLVRLPFHPNLLQMEIYAVAFI